MEDITFPILVQSSEFRMMSYELLTRVHCYYDAFLAQFTQSEAKGTLVLLVILLSFYLMHNAKAQRLKPGC